MSQNYKKKIEIKKNKNHIKLEEKINARKVNQNTK